MSQLKTSTIRRQLAARYAVLPVFCHPGLLKAVDALRLRARLDQFMMQAK